jgi:hypothetical protein
VYLHISPSVLVLLADSFISGVVDQGANNDWKSDSVREAQLLGYYTTLSVCGI